MKNKKIGVLMGGLSREREISLRSGHAIATALASRGYDVVSIDVGRDVAERIAREKIEVAFIALHGRFGEDGTIQGLLEMIGIPYTGSGVLASAVAIDKDLTKRLVAQAGVRTPAWKMVSRDQVGAIRESPLPLPVIVKPNREGSTIGMSIVHEGVGALLAAPFKQAIEMAATYDTLILVEAFIVGTEVTVGILDGKALPVLEIVPKGGWYDFQAKYTKGMTEYIVPARIAEEVRHRASDLSERIFSLLRLSGFARLDFIIDREGNDWFLEVNTIPGMTSLSLLPMAANAIGLGFEDLCERMLATASLKV